MADNSRSQSLHRVLVIGVGSIGERHVRCFLKTGRATVSICEVNRSLREEIGARYGIADRFADLDAACAVPHDAAVIAVPADAHVPAARSAVARGMHLLIEKPLAVSFDGVADLMVEVEQAHRVAAVGYVYRAHPALEAMRDAIRNGLLGSPIEVVVVAGQNFPTYRPAFRQSYYADRARGGGAIQDAMTHLSNAAEWLVGPIDRVVADADHKLLDGVNVEDVVHFLARHGGILGSYSLNQFQAPNEVTITVVCTGGTARFEYHRNRWRRMLRPDEPWQDEPAPTLERDTLFVRQAASFLDAIESGVSPLCTLAEAAHSLQVNLALLKSLADGRWQRIGQDHISARPLPSRHFYATG